MRRFRFFHAFPLKFFANAGALIDIFFEMWYTVNRLFSIDREAQLQTKKGK